MDISPKYQKSCGLGFLITKKGRTKRPRSRTAKTYQNKLNKLKSKYNKIAKLKGSFLQKFPTFEDFLKGYKLKEVVRGSERVSKSSTIINRSRFAFGGK